MELDATLDKAMQLFVATREDRQRAEKSLRALLRKEEQAANTLAELVRQRLPS